MLKLDAVTDAYRLVHSEADGLSGLVVDRFGDTLVIEFFAAGMFKQRAAIMDALRATSPRRGSTGSPRSTSASRSRSTAAARSRRRRTSSPSTG